MENKFIDRIKAGIAFAEKHNDELDDYGFGTEEGILISVNEAKTILKEIEAVKNNSPLPSVMCRLDRPNIRESIFDGEDCVIPMADVSFVEKHWIKDYLKGEEKTKHNWHGLTLIMKHTVYDMTADTWANNAYLSRAEGEKFLKAWCIYRNEIENIRNDT